MAFHQLTILILNPPYIGRVPHFLVSLEVFIFVAKAFCVATFYLEPFLYREGSIFLRKQVKYYFSIKIVKEIKPRHFVVFLENVEPSLYREDSTYLLSFTVILVM